MRELREEYTYEDALKANAVLDMYADIELAMEELSKKDNPQPQGTRT